MSLVGSQTALGIQVNLGLCEDWAEKHGDWEAAHNSFVALESLYDLQSAALKEELYPDDRAPSVCRVFQDYQLAFRNAVMAAISDHLSEEEGFKNAERASDDFRARFRSDDDLNKAIGDLSACYSWASKSDLKVIALKVRQLEYELNEDSGPLPADIGNTMPVCRNAYSEANQILDFVGNHANDDAVMPSDVGPYYERATAVMHCAEQLEKTVYSTATNHLLLAVAGINNIMVIADGNAEMKLIRALPAPQPNRPIIIHVQNSYEQDSRPMSCSGTITHFAGASFSNIDWDCQR